MLTSSLGVACLALVVGYLFGSIPFGMILTRLAGTQDLRSIGSGNIGATNVLRTGNKGLAAATLLLDMLKGTAAVLVAGIYGTEFAIAAGLGAFIGHLFPVWLGFKGGKGVATYIGVLFGLMWQVGLLFLAIWIAVAVAFRYSSLSALTGCVVIPIVLWFLDRPDLAILFAVMSVIVFMKHRANISRLIAGAEGKIGAKG